MPPPTTRTSNLSFSKRRSVSGRVAVIALSRLWSDVRGTHAFRNARKYEVGGGGGVRRNGCDAFTLFCCIEVVAASSLWLITMPRTANNQEKPSGVTAGFCVP
jgi:hypothetical protein